MKHTTLCYFVVSHAVLFICGMHVSRIASLSGIFGKRLGFSFDNAPGPLWRRTRALPERPARPTCPDDHYDMLAWCPNWQCGDRPPAIRASCITPKPSWKVAQRPPWPDRLTAGVDWAALGFEVGGATRSQRRHLTRISHESRLEADLLVDVDDPDAAVPHSCVKRCAAEAPTRNASICAHWCDYFRPSHLAAFEPRLRLLGRVLPGLRSGQLHAVLDVGGGAGGFALAAARLFGVAVTTTNGVFEWKSGGLDGYKPFPELLAQVRSHAPRASGASLLTTPFVLSTPPTATRCFAHVHAHASVAPRGRAHAATTRSSTSSR